MSNNTDALNNLKTQLEQEFGNVEIVDKGNDIYSFTIDGKTEIYANTNTLLSNNVNIYSYIPGSGGSMNDAALIRNAVNNGTLNDGIYTIGYGCGDEGNSPDIAMRFTECLNKKVEQLNTYGFSAGAQATMQNTSIIAEKYPDLDISMYLIDGFSVDDSQLSKFDLSSLRNDNIKIYAVGPNESGVNFNRIMGQDANIQEQIKRLQDKYGLDVKFYEELNSQAQHQNINEDAIMEFLLKATDEGGFKLLLYYEDEDKFKLVSIPGEFNIVLNDSKNNENSQILSDINVVMDKVNAISSAMKNNDGLFFPKTQEITSTASIINGVVSAQNVFLSVSNDLHHRVRDELLLINKIAQNYYDMDGDLSSLASNLSTANTISFDNDRAYTNLNELVGLEYNNSVNFFKNFQIPIANDVTKIGCVNISDIENIMSPSGSIMSNLQSEIDCAKSTKSEIENLSNVIGTNLKGPVWNTVKDNLFVLSDLQDKRLNSCQKLMLTINEAMKKIKEYMYPDTSLDTTRIPELRNQVTNLKLDIEELQDKIDAQHQVTKSSEGVDSLTGKYIKSEYKVWEYVYSDTEREAFREEITNIQKMIETLEAEIYKLEGFEEIIKDATNMINNEIQNIYNDYGTQVSNYVTGRVNSYTPSFSGNTANFDYLSFANTVPNALGIPYINQDDYDGTMSIRGCGWATLAMIVSGLSGNYITADQIYQIQTGTSGGIVNISTAQREDFGVSSGAGDPNSNQMEIFNKYGITPESLSIRNNPNSSSVIASSVDSGKAVAICTDTHYSLIAPGENGGYVYMSSSKPSLNKEYSSVEEIFKAAGINNGNINYGVAYSTNNVSNAISVPTYQYSTTDKNYMTPVVSLPGNVTSDSSMNQHIVSISNENNYMEHNISSNIPVNNNISQEIINDNLAFTTNQTTNNTNTPSITTPSETPIINNDTSSVTTPSETPIINNDTSSVTTPSETPIINNDASSVTTPSETPIINNNTSSTTKPIETLNKVPSYNNNYNDGYNNIINENIIKPTNEIPSAVTDSNINNIENQLGNNQDNTFIELPPKEPANDNIVTEIPKPNSFDEEIIDITNADINKISKSQDIAKSIGVVAGVGAVVGGTAFGAHKYVKSKEDLEEKSYDEEKDY